MYTLFAMLFGAGLVLMDSRAELHGQRLAGTYYRRLLWLFLFGLVHAYFVWEGDILVAYAMCGAMLYPFRRLSPKLLIPLGLLGYSVVPLAETGLGYLIDWVETTAKIAETAGNEAAEWQRFVKEIWTKASAELNATPELLAEEKQIMLGGYWTLFQQRAMISAGVQFASLVLLNWGFLGIMLCGISLMKAGVITASKSIRFYVVLTLTGYLVGLPLVSLGLYDAAVHEFDLGRQLRVSVHFHELGSIFVTLGHVGLVMLICKAGLFPWATLPLAAAGRMALTNYLTQSLVCASIFYGWGFGQFGQWSRVELLLVVASIWLVQLVGSSLWLRWFQFGPAEYLWRSLTYGKRQQLFVRVS